MKPTQNTVIHILLGVSVVTAIVLLYALLAPTLHQGLSLRMWTVFGGAALALVLAAFLPSWLRARRGLLPVQLSPADIRFFIIVAIAGMTMALMGGYIGMLGIMLTPLAFLFRRPRTQ